MLMTMNYDEDNDAHDDDKTVCASVITSANKLAQITGTYRLMKTSVFRN